MKRFFSSKLVLPALIAALLFTAASMPVFAAPAPMEFMTTNTIRPALPFVYGEYDFDLYNRTKGWVLNGFYTQEDGKWSKNWLSYKLPPGKSVHMVWSAASNKGECVVPFKTTWDDYDQAETHKIDWCKGIKNLYLQDDAKLTADYK